MEKAKKHIYLSGKVHAELKKQAKAAGKMLNQAFADDIVALGLSVWKNSTKKI